MNVLDRNDISEINALILKIKEYGEYCENCVDVKFDSNKKQIEVGRTVEGNFLLRYRMEFKDYFSIRNWLDGFYTGLVF